MHTSSVLVCNAGSSSLKLALYRIEGAQYHIQLQHNVAGDADTLTVNLRETLAGLPQPTAVLHRIVHAGRVPEGAVPLEALVLEQIRHWTPLAALHNSLALQLLDICLAAWPQGLQYAVFDSGLYTNLPLVAQYYALPQNLSPRWPIQRYGFHGLAHRSQWRTVRELAAQAELPAPSSLISVQLGGGCSITAWRDDTAVDTSMGFTPLEGLVMAQRSGTIDAGILLHLQRNEGFTPEQLDDVLNRRSGLAAVAGGAGDIRELLAAGTQSAQTAVDHYCYQIRRHIGAAMAVLGSVDAISFGGGVGEHQALVRQKVLEGLQGLGIVLDLQRNAAADTACALHSAHSRTAVYLTPVNEMEEMIRQYLGS